MTLSATMTAMPLKPNSARMSQLYLKRRVTMLPRNSGASRAPVPDASCAHDYCSFQPGPLGGSALEKSNIITAAEYIVETTELN